MQHLLYRAFWNADAVCDDVSEYAVEHLHNEDGVLVVDETVDVNKGTHTVGVQLQYTGAAGGSRTSRSLSASPTSASAGTRRWTESCISRAPGRAIRTAAGPAGLSEDTVLVTKPELAQVMIERFLDTGHRVGWVTGGEA
ncbi:transposase [Streptomyces sp. NPDC001840]